MQQCNNISDSFTGVLLLNTTICDKCRHFIIFLYNKVDQCQIGVGFRSLHRPGSLVKIFITVCFTVLTVK